MNEQTIKKILLEPNFVESRMNILQTGMIKFYPNTTEVLSEKSKIRPALAEQQWLRRIIPTVEIECFNIYDKFANAFTIPNIKKELLYEYNSLWKPFALILYSWVYAAKNINISEKNVRFDNGLIYMPHSIKYIPIFYTIPIKKITSPKELLAVSLHEVFHHGQYLNTFISYMTGGLTAPLATVLRILFLSYDKLTHLNWVPNGLYKLIPFALISLLYIHSYYNRKMEYTADKMTSLYGLGSELISALNKIDEYNRKVYEKEKTIIAYIENVFLYLSKNIFEPLGLTDHPSTDKRKIKIDQLNSVILQTDEIINNIDLEFSKLL